MKKEIKNKPFENLEIIDETSTHFIARCPYCGDSENHKNKGHFYLSKTKPVYFCQRCTASGNIHELEEILNEECKIEYISSNNLKNNNYNINTIIENIQKGIVKNKYNNLNVDEFNYIKNRCPKILELEDFQNIFRIISTELVLKKFKNKFQINTLTDRVWFLSGLGTTFIGRTYIEHDIRYMKISENNLDWESDIINDSYVINNYQNIKNPDTLIIAEGIFDIIPIYLNRKKYGIKDNAIFMACLGLFYNRSVKTFQNIFSLKPKNIQIFADKGVFKDMIDKQFSIYKRTSNIILNYPPIKDWEETPLPKLKFSLRE